MRRRDFMAGLGAAAAWPAVARAQAPVKLPRIGFLGATTPSAQKLWNDAFEQRLRELDWVNGRNIIIDYRWANGRQERAADVCAEFVRLNVDVIVTHTAPLTSAAKRATSLTPIVFALAADPVGTGLVAGLARPGANVTGMSVQLADTAGKRLELLAAIVPGLRRLAMIATPTDVAERREVQAVARGLNIEITTADIKRPEDIGPAFAAMKGSAEAVYVCTDPLMNTSRVAINTSALDARLASVCGFREFVDAGGLISYGAYYPALFRRTAEIVDKILRGAKPADIPVEQPTKFELVVNMKTAKTLGLTIPETVLATADEVIQ